MLPTHMDVAIAEPQLNSLTSPRYFTSSPIVDPYTREPLDGAFEKIFLSKGILCPGPNMEWPPNVVPVVMPEGSGMTACYVTLDDKSGILLVTLSDSFDEAFDSNLDISELCGKLGITLEDVQACAKNLVTGRVPQVYDHRFAPPGTEFQFNFTEGFTKIPLGLFKREDVSLEAVVKAYQSMSTLSTQEIQDLLAIISENPTALPTATASITPPPSMTVAVATSTFESQSTSSQAPTSSESADTSEGPDATSMALLLMMIVAVGGAGLMFSNKPK